RSPDDLSTAGTRTSAASRDELTKALTQPSTYDPITLPVFALPATVPVMPWKAQPTVGQIRGTIAGGSHALAQLRDATGATPRTTTSDASGWFGFVDVPPGPYTIVAPSSTFTAIVVAGQVVTATPVCTSSTGPGIPPPAVIPAGIPGFHAAWYGQ